MKKKVFTILAIAVALLLTMTACSPSLMNSLSNFDPGSLTFPAYNSPEPSTDPATQPPEATTAPTTIFDDYVGKPLSEFMAKVSEAGYTATYFDQGEDITGLEEWLGDSFLVDELKEDPIAKTVEVEVISKSAIEQEEKEKALREKLETGSAWIAVKKYGEAQYGSAFELHYFMGKIAQEAEDENTWFLKAECTVLGVDMVCEAKVTGTSDNPEVISFTVY